MNKNTKVVLIGFLIWMFFTYLDYILLPKAWIWLSIMLAGLLIFVGSFFKNESNNTDNQSG